MTCIKLVSPTRLGLAIVIALVLQLTWNYNLVTSEEVSGSSSATAAAAAVAASTAASKSGASSDTSAAAAAGAASAVAASASSGSGSSSSAAASASAGSRSGISDEEDLDDIDHPPASTKCSSDIEKKCCLMGIKFWTDPNFKLDKSCKGDVGKRCCTRAVMARQGSNALMQRDNILEKLSQCTFGIIQNILMFQFEIPQECCRLPVFGNLPWCMDSDPAAPKSTPMPPITPMPTGMPNKTRASFNRKSKTKSHIGRITTKKPVKEEDSEDYSDDDN